MILMLSNYWNPTTNVKRYFQAGGSPVALESRGENDPFRGAVAREYSLELWDVSARKQIGNTRLEQVGFPAQTALSWAVLVAFYMIIYTRDLASAHLYYAVLEDMTSGNELH
jgi:hypothetical protein